MYSHPFLVYVTVAIVGFLLGLWVGRHPERVRAAEKRIADEVRRHIHSATADPPATPPAATTTTTVVTPPTP